MTQNSRQLAYLAVAIGVLLSPLVPMQVRAALSDDQRWQAGYDDAYFSTYDGHMKPQKSHTQAYINGFDAGIAARGQPRQAQAQSSESNAAASSKSDNHITINNILPSSGKNSDNNDITTERAFADPSFFNQKADTSIVRITLLDSKDRNVHDVRFYIKEHPEYGAPDNNRAFTDLTEAFNPDFGTYTNKITMDLVFPSSLIGEGEKFHICMDEMSLPKDRNNPVACYELTNDMRDELTVNTGDL